MLEDLLKRNRSYRRFHEGEAVSRATLEDLVRLVRLCPTAANLQPLRFLLSWERATNDEIFPHLRWAGYLADWEGPAEGERPSAYIVVLQDLEIDRNRGIDHGIAAQSMLLGAVERGLGGCIVGSIARDDLRQALRVPERYEILITLALGKPREEVVLEEARTGDIRYWRDGEGVHHVPKRPLAELILPGF